MSEPSEVSAVPPPLGRHLARGALGFGLIGCSFALGLLVGPAALLIAPLGMVLLRGCPMCWLLGLIEILSARRLSRDCPAGRCELTRGQQKNVLVN